MDEDLEDDLVMLVVECQKRDEQTDNTIINIVKSSRIFTAIWLYLEFLRIDKHLKH